MMKNTQCGAGAADEDRRPSGGFSLLELIVAMAVFLVVGATSFSLFSRHEVLLSQEQGIAGLNIGLRNALGQLQMDVVNAGYGIIQGPNVPAWPVGVTLVNSNPTTAQCNPAATNPPTYAAACFDQLYIVMVDTNTAPMHPQSAFTTNSAGATVQINASPSSSNFKSGDQILFVTAGPSHVKFTTAVLTANGATSGGSVQLTFNSTLSGGTNTPCSGTPPCNDPLSMTTNGSHVNTNGTTVTWVSGNKFVAGTNWDGQLVEINNQYYTVTAPAGNPATLTGLTLTTTAGTQSNVPFFPGPSVTSSFGTSDWVLRLLPIQYNVDVSNASDPRLMRTQAGTATAVMDQVIGFKVGAAWWNNNVSTFQYEYNSSNYYNDYTLVRAVRVSLIGRTSPSTQPGYQYRNPFDSGPYQIRGNSIVVNPRSLTMNND